MRRPGYREAVRWIAYNDDAEWTRDAEPVISVTGALVCDLFDVTTERLVADIRRELAKIDRAPR